MKSCICTLFCLFTFGLTAGTQDPYRQLVMDHLSVSEGLSNSVVNTIIQDKYGFIWIGTDDGLNRYDGYSFATYRSTITDSTSLPSSFILSSFLDRTGRLWFGTQRGTCYYDPAADHFVQVTNSMHVNQILEGDSVMILNTNGGLRILTASLDSITEITVNQGLYSNSILSMHHLLGEVYALIYTDRISLLSLDGLQEWSFLLPQEDEEFIACSRADRNNNVYVLTSKRVARIQLGEKIELIRSFPLPFSRDGEETPLSILLDSTRKLWIGTKEHIYSLNLDNGEFTPVEVIVDNYPAGKTRIESIYEDRYGNLWFGEYGNGVLLSAKFKNHFRHFEHHSFNPGSLSQNMVASFAEDRQGSIWIGTWGGGLNTYYPADQTINRYSFNDPVLNSEVFRGACFDGEGRLWLATDNDGVVSLNIENGSYKHFRYDPDDPGSLPSDNLYTVVSIRDGEIWTAHSAGASVARFNPESEKFEALSRDTVHGLHLEQSWIRAILEDRQNNLWLGTYGSGVHLLDLDDTVHLNISTTENPAGESFLSNDVIYALHEDSRGLLWIGTMGGGLNILDPETMEILHLYESDGLANNVVNGILEDDHQNLWISTNNGISRFDIPEFLYSDTVSYDAFSRYDFRSRFLNYDINDGLQNNEFKYAAHYRSSTGEMYFGGISGFNVFHPDSIEINSREPEIVLTDLQIYHMDYPVHDKKLGREKFIDDLELVELKHNQNFITIHFVALNYNNPLKNQYRFKLEGLETTWNTTQKVRSATYANLKPGEYLFQIMASNNDGVWTMQPRELRILIHPPLWGHIWFQMLAILLVLGAFYSFHRYRLYMLRQRSEELERRVDRRTEQLRLAKEALENSKNEIEEMANKIHETDVLKLKFFTNISHEFRTPLTLIIGPVEKLLGRNDLGSEMKHQLKVVYRNALRLLRLVNELLDIRKLDTGNIRLQVAERNLVSFVKGVAALFEYHAQRRGIRFSVPSDTTRIPVWFDPDLMEKVFYNLFSNAFKYTRDSGTIEIMVAPESPEHPGKVKVVVKDNGKGISPEHLNYIFDRYYQIQQSKESRAEHGSGIGLALCKEYIELHGGTISVESNINEGSAFTVLLPVGREHFKADQILPGEEFFDSTEMRSIYYSEYLGDESLVIDESNGSDLPLILVIDDNTDMLAYIRDTLSGSFRILLATHGAEGLQKAFDQMPDLILCDIMMPEIDGLEITREMKTDDRTNHIPIILLSARASEEDRVSGLSLGADDYIIKPFSSKVLIAKVTTVIENRKKIQQRFQDEIGFNPGSFLKETPEDRFVAKAIDVLEENLANEEFNTEAFASLMGLSRAQLYRKISAITDQSASEFIRSFRMRKASELLLKGDLNVSEVAYQVGFKSLSHFTRTFSSLFNLSPTQYISRHKG